MKWGLVAAVLGGAMLIGAGLQAQTPPEAPPKVQATAALAAAPALTKKDLDTWLDGFVPQSLATSGIAGAAVVVVKDGQVLTERGYGYADIASRRPVDPARTLLRTGSVGKLFTWTAVMQLVEQGRIDLDADVNRYLDFKVPPRDGKPITMRNLMTHSAGFEEHLKRLFVDSPARRQPLGVYLKTWQPKRVYAPGAAPGYSNYGASMAGYIVERVSGEPFDDYVERHIFRPLGMARSTFAEPPPARLEADMASGYHLASDPAVPFEVANPSPVGASSTTADDMARFMIAHLQNGSYGDTRILQDATARQMHSEQARTLPLRPAMALGFFTDARNGHRMLNHGGDTLAFHTELVLLPDDGVGLYVAVNSEGKDFAEALRNGLVNGFVDRYFPSAGPAQPTVASAKADGQAMVGRYWSSRRSHSSFFALANLLGQAKVAANPDGTIQVSSLTDLSGAPIRWREIGPFVWVSPAGDQLTAAVKDGRVMNFAAGSFGEANQMQRVPAWADGAWNRPLLITTVALLLITIIAWPLQALVRRCYGAAFPLSGRRALLYRGVRLVAIADLLALATYAFVLSKMQDAHYLDSPIDPWIHLGQLLSLIGVVGVLIAVWNTVATWADSASGWWAKSAAGLAAVACLAFTWFAVSLHLVGISTQF